MFEPKLTDPHPESAKTYPQKVFCKQRNCEADVVAANWPFSEEGWSDWCIIDCSLLPGRSAELRNGFPVADADRKEVGLRGKAHALWQWHCVRGSRNWGRCYRGNERSALRSLIQTKSTEERDV
jgi:hypothetical protein